MRFWAKIFTDNHLIRDTTVEVISGENRTMKVFQALEDVCLELDLPVPIWLKPNVKEFQKNASTRFRADSFIEDIPFDYLEFQVIEEDL